MRSTLRMAVVLVTVLAAPAFAAPASAQSFLVVKTADGYAITAKLVGAVPEGMPQAGLLNWRRAPDADLG